MNPLVLMDKMNQNKAFRRGIDARYEKRFQQVSHNFVPCATKNSEMQFKDFAPNMKILKHNPHQFSKCLCAIFYAWSIIQTFRNHIRKMLQITEKKDSYITVIIEIFPVDLLLWRF